MECKVAGKYALSIRGSRNLPVHSVWSSNNTVPKCLALLIKVSTKPAYSSRPDKVTGAVLSRAGHLSGATGFIISNQKTKKTLGTGHVCAVLFDSDLQQYAVLDSFGAKTSLLCKFDLLNFTADTNVCFADDQPSWGPQKTSQAPAQSSSPACLYTALGSSVGLASSQPSIDMDVTFHNKSMWAITREGQPMSHKIPRRSL